MNRTGHEVAKKSIHCNKDKNIYEQNSRLKNIFQRCIFMISYTEEEGSTRLTHKTTIMRLCNIR